MENSIFKSSYGWEAKTEVTRNGKTFSIYTYRNFHRDITTSVTRVLKTLEDQKEFESLCILKTRILSVNHGELKGTENEIQKAHMKAMDMFEKKIQQP